jgi:transcriptional regulator with XRE-family HTH domain
MLDDLAGKRTGERIQILRERRGLSRPVLAGLVGMSAAQDADTPAALAGAAWTLGMVQRSAGDTDGALTLAAEAADLLEPRLEDAGDELRGMYGALQLHAATTAARAGREGDAWRHWDAPRATAGRLPGGYYHPWTMFGAANVKLHAVSIAADLSRSAEARSHAEDIDPEQGAARPSGRGDRPDPARPARPDHRGLRRPQGKP